MMGAIKIRAIPANTSWLILKALQDASKSCVALRVVVAVDEPNHIYDQ